MKHGLVYPRRGRRVTATPHDAHLVVLAELGHPVDGEHQVLVVHGVVLGHHGVVGPSASLHPSNASWAPAAVWAHEVADKGKDALEVDRTDLVVPTFEHHRRASRPVDPLRRVLGQLPPFLRPDVGAHHVRDRVAGGCVEISLTNLTGVLLDRQATGVALQLQAIRVLAWADQLLVGVQDVVVDLERGTSDAWHLAHTRQWFDSVPGQTLSHTFSCGGTPTALNCGSI